MKAQVCPYLGLRGDSDTAFAYPSPANHCFRATTARSVKQDHQRKHCLSDNHVECKWFQGEAGQSQKHIKDIAHRSRQRSPGNRRLLVGIFATVIVAVVIFWLVLSWLGGNLATPPGVDSETPPTTLIENTKTPSPNTDLPSPSTTAVVPTPTMQVVHALDIPIGTQTPLVIHRVLEGESLPYLARHFNTTEEAIMTINYNLFLPLWSNAVIVIPLNQVNVNNLPMFEPYRVTESISLKALAAKFSADIEMLKVYNLVDSEHVFWVGEWVLIPHLRQATPVE
jgi:hypothetical protein